jgi:hypothetical protein
MLKKIMKAALAASLVFGFSSMAMAEAKVSGDAHAYFGQYNSGVTGASAYWATAYEGHINVDGTTGPLSGHVQIETRDRYSTAGQTACAVVPGGATDNATRVYNMQANVTYTTGALGVTIGTVVANEGCEFVYPAGLGTSSVSAYASVGGCRGYFEQEGIQIKYAIPALKGYAALTIQGNTGGKGQEMAVSSRGMIADMIVYRLLVLNASNDDFNVSTDSAKTDAYTSLGVVVPLGTPKMRLLVDYTSQDLKTSDKKEADMGLGFEMDELGPGTLGLYYGTEAKKTSGVKTTTTSKTGLAYSIPFAPGAKAQFFYASKATKSEAVGGTTTTASYMGGGLTVKY